MTDLVEVPVQELAQSCEALLSSAEKSFRDGNYYQSRQLISQLEDSSDWQSSGSQERLLKLRTPLKALKLQLKPEPVNLFILAATGLLLLTITCAAYFNAL